MKNIVWFFVFALFVIEAAMPQSFTYSGPSSSDVPYQASTVSPTYYFEYSSTQGLIRPKLIVALDGTVISQTLCDGNNSFLPESYQVSLSAGTHILKFSLLSVDPDFMDCNRPLIHHEVQCTVSVAFTIKICNNFTGGTIYADNYTTPKSSPHYRASHPGDVISLGAIDQNGGTYYRLWNTSGNLQSEWVKLANNVTTSHSSQRNCTYTVQSNDNSITLEADLRKRFDVTRILDLSEFDDEAVSAPFVQIVEGNSGDMEAPTTHTTNGRAYKFAGWTDGETDTSRTISPEDNETYTALYKYPKHSNSQDGYSTNSQRKFARTPDGWLHSVYESMGRVWYEASSNNGSTWLLQNSGLPLDQLAAKQPSIAASTELNRVFIAYQEKADANDYFDVNVKYFARASNETSYSLQTSHSFEEGAYSYSGVNSYPAIAIGRGGNRGILVYRVEEDEYTVALRYHIFKYVTGGPSYFTSLEDGSLDILPADEGMVSVAASNSVVELENIGNVVFHTAWNKIADGREDIYYRKVFLDDYENITWEDEMNLSADGGYSENFNPSVTSFNDGARVCWVGRYVIEENEEEMQKTTAEEENEIRQIVFHDPENSSAYWHFGTLASGPSINKTLNGSTQADTKYAFGWLNGTSAYFADNSLSTIYTMNQTNKKEVQLSNGYNPSDLSDIFANVFASSSQPYAFTSTNNLEVYINGVPKSLSASIAAGREGIIRKDGRYFYYCLGDILLNDSKVKFVEYPQSLRLTSLEQVNQYTISQPMAVTGQSVLDYSVMYGVLDTLATAAAFTGDEHIRFKVLLLDAETGETLGEYDNVEYSAQNAVRYRNLAYRLSLQGIGNRTVRLALKIETNCAAGYSLATKLAVDNVLMKRGSARKEIAFAENAVTDYALYQNYPNPFNPATTISYALPKDGAVTLKVYDILGKEMRTLVNEEKTAGRYTVSFNASPLPSGTYFYELRAGDFREVRKMMLVK